MAIACHQRLALVLAAPMQPVWILSPVRHGPCAFSAAFWLKSWIGTGQLILLGLGPSGIVGTNKSLIDEVGTSGVLSISANHPFLTRAFKHKSGPSIIRANSLASLITQVAMLALLALRSPCFRNEKG